MIPEYMAEEEVVNTQTDPLKQMDKEAEAGSSGYAAQSLSPEISIREWYEGTKQILKERTSYKHRLDMIVLVGAEPIFEFK